MVPNEHDRASPSPAPATADADLYCLSCGYNLRGLAGDPIRCPECGRSNPVATLVGTDADAEGRGRELRAALDVSVVAELLLAGAVVAVPLLPCAVLLLLSGTVLFVPAWLELRRLCQPRREWRRAARAFLLWSLLIALTVPGLWAAGSFLSWGVLTVSGAGSGARLAHVGVGAGLCAAVLATRNPFPSLRKRQAAAFEELLRCARAAPPGR